MSKTITVPTFATTGLTAAVTLIRDTFAASLTSDAHGQNAEAGLKVLAEVAGKLTQVNA